MHKRLASLVCILKGDFQSPDVVPEFELIDPGPDQLAVFHIKQGLYKGTQYRVGRVTFVPKGDGFALSYVIDIINHPWWGKIKDSDKDFTMISGNILKSVMERNADDYGNFLVM